MASANRIHCQGPFRKEEYKAGASGLYPGYLVRLNSTGHRGEVVVHNVIGDPCEAMFLMEDALRGRNVDHVYTSGDVASIILPGKGSVVLAMIEDGADINIGDKLMSNGNGKLIEAIDFLLDSAGMQCYVVGVALEENLSTESGVGGDQLIQVRIL